MPTKVFVDTNIVVDFLMKREPFDKPAALLFDKAHRGGIEAFVPATVFPFVFYLLSKSLNSKASAWEAVARFRQLVTLLPVDRQVIDLALASKFKDLKDAVQYQLAKANAMDFFITRNLQDFKKSDIPVLTAESFMKQFAD